MHTYQNIIKSKINPRILKYKSLYSTYKADWRNYYYRVFDPTTMHISRQRTQIHCHKRWIVEPGKKNALYKSNMTNKQLFMDDKINWNGWKHNEEITYDILHVAAKHNFIGEKEIKLFYGNNLSKLCINTCTWKGGSSMHLHKDVSNRDKRIGFDRKLIAIGTIEVINGSKILSFSGHARMMMNRMNVNQRPGDLTIMSYPATESWWHFVPPVQADRATNIQWRSTFE